MRVNGNPAAKPSSRLILGDQVEVPLPPLPERRE